MSTALNKFVKEVFERNRKKREFWSKVIFAESVLQKFDEESEECRIMENFGGDNK